MNDYYPEDGSGAKYLWAFLAGLLTGGMVGAGVMLLLAPQSGRRTQAQLRRKSIELRQQTAEAVEDTVTKARSRAGQMTDDVRERADDLGHRAQAVFDEQSERLSSTVKAGKKAVRDLQG